MLHQIALCLFDHVAHLPIDQFRYDRASYLMVTQIGTHFNAVARLFPKRQFEKLIQFQQAKLQ